MKTSEKKYASVLELNGVPRFKEAFPLALQHVVAMVVGCITPAILVANTTQMSQEDKTLLIQAALVIAAIATALQLFPIFGRIGAGLPIIMGVSFAYVPTLQAIGGEFGIATILGAQICGGAAAILVGIFIKYLRPLFPPLVAGTVVFTIGLSLYPVAIKYMAGGAGSETFGAPLNWGIAILTMAAVVFFNYFTKGFCKLASILLGLIVGYVVAFFCGMVSFDNIGASGWFQVPIPMHFGLDFQATAIISMVIMYVVNSVQAIGDLSSTTGGAMDRVPTDKELSGGIIGNGVSSILGAFFGGLPTATFSQNVGIVIVTKVINRCVLGLAAVIILIAGLIPKFAAILTTIPQCVLGGATIMVFASITMTGIKLILTAGLTPRNSTAVGLAVAIGVGISQVGGALAGPGMPGWVNDIFGTSSVIVSTIFVIIFNLVLPKDKNQPKEEPVVQEIVKEEAMKS